MKVILHGTCSECYGVTDLVLSSKDKEIVCPTCGHSVPQLEVAALNSLAKDQGKRTMLGVVAGVALLAAAGLFVGFIAKAGGGVPGSVAKLPGGAVGMLVGSIVMLLVSLGTASAASSRSYVCEF